MTTATVYLSCAMRGTVDNNRGLFEEWAKRFRDAGMRVHSPIELGDKMAKGLKRLPTRREYLSLDLDMLCLNADAVCVLEYSPEVGAQPSKGVQAEVAVADALDIPVWILGRVFPFNNTWTRYGIANHGDPRLTFDELCDTIRASVAKEAA